MTIKTSLVNNYQEYVAQERNYLFFRTRAVFGDEIAQYFSQYRVLYTRGSSGTIYRCTFHGPGYKVMSASNTDNVTSRNGGPRSDWEFVQTWSFCMQSEIPSEHQGFFYQGGHFDSFSQVKLSLIQVITHYLLIRADEHAYLSVANYFKEQVTTLEKFLHSHRVFE